MSCAMYIVVIVMRHAVRIIKEILTAVMILLLLFLFQEYGKSKFCHCYNHSNNQWLQVCIVHPNPNYYFNMLLLLLLLQKNSSIQYVTGGSTTNSYNIKNYSALSYQYTCRGEFDEDGTLQSII